MKNTINIFRKLLKKNVCVILIYELILKLMTILLVFPVLINSVEYTLGKRGITFVTRGNIMKLITDPVMITVMILIFLEYIIFLLYETGCLAVCFEYTLSKKKIGLWSLFYLGFVKARVIIRNFRMKTILALFFVSGLINIHLAVILYMKADVFRMIMEYIFRRPTHIYMVFGAVVLTGMTAAGIIMCRAGSALVENSRSLRKICLKDYFSSLFLVLITNIIISAFLIVLYISAIFIAAVIVKYTGESRFAFTRLVKAERYLFVFIAFIAYSASVMFNYAIIYSFGTGRRKKDKKMPKLLHVPASWQKRKKKSKAAAAAVITAVIIIDIITAAKYLFNNTILMEDFIISTTVTAHRGGAQFAPENTMDSVKYAIESGADYIEIDVQLTSDGTVILLHDDNLKRTTGYNGVAERMNYEDIQKLNAGIKFGAAFSESYVPTFDEVLTECKGKINLNVELKKSSRSGYELADKVIELISSHDMMKQCVITSTSYPYLRYVKLNAPSLRTGIISNSYIGDPAALEFADFFSVKYTVATASFVNSAHRAGKDVHVWTINSKSLMSRMKGMDVDSIITDNPVLCRKILRRKNDGKSIIELFQTLLKK